LYHNLNRKELWLQLLDGDILQELFDWEGLNLVEPHVPLNERYNLYMTEQELTNQTNYNSGANTIATQVNPNLPPKTRVVNEPFVDSVSESISSEDYIRVMSKLNEYADSTLSFGETLLRNIEAGLNDQLLTQTVDKIAKRSEELITTGSTTSLSFLRRTKDAIVAGVGTASSPHERDKI
jgi:hypothetical protein